MFTRAGKWVGPLVNPPMSSSDEIQRRVSGVLVCKKCGRPLKYVVEQERGLCVDCMDKELGLKIFKTEAQKETDKWYAEYEKKLFKEMLRRIRG